MSSSSPERTTPPDELRRRRDELEIILGGVAEAIFARDANGRVTFTNAAGARMLGFESPGALVAAAATGDPFAAFDMFDEHDAPLPSEKLPYARIFAGEPAPPDVVVRLRHRASQTESSMHVASRAVLDDEGKPLLAISIHRDVTERQRAEEAVRVSHEWFATTLRSIGDAVIATDAAGRVTFMNEVAVSLTGWSIADAQGHDLKDVFHIINEQTRVEVESPVAKVIREGVVVGLANHTILIRRDGAELAIDDSGAPIRNAARELVGVVLVFRDVSEKRREEARRMFVAEASAVLASSLDYATTLQAVTRLAVPALADWCAIDICEEGGPCQSLAFSHVDARRGALHEELQRRFPVDMASGTGVAAVVRTGQADIALELGPGELEKLAPDAEQRRLLSELGLASRIIMPLRARGRTLGAITFAQATPNKRFTNEDVPFTEQLASAAALAVDNARLYATAQEASRLKDEFLATVSHELRTPLNAMLGWARMLRDSKVDDARRDHGLGVIERNAQAQARLIDELLDVSRIVSGKLRLDVRVCDLAAILESAVEGHRPAAQGKHVRIDVHIHRLVPPFSGDPGRLEQVVWNLVSNAVKFTPAGGVVAVSLLRKGSTMELVVADTGEGIPREFLPFVFDRFRQATLTTTKIHTGLGLGLAIVKHIVELHGGTVTAESDGIGKGARFTVRLPLSSAAVALEASAPSLEPRVEHPDLTGVKVLCVDDDEDNRELVAQVLAQCGAIVRGAASAAEALALVEAEAPDLVVSDIGMPGEDGYSLIKKLRALPAERGGRARAIALTAFARAQDRSAALIAGFHAHVPKPIDPRELALVAAALLGRSRG